MVGFQNLKCVLLNKFYVCVPTSLNLKPHLVSKVRKVYWQNGGQGPIMLGVMSLDRFSNFAILENLLGFQILPFLKIFVTDFSGTMKARNLKVCINMENDWMYCKSPNRGQEFITLGFISLGRFSKN